MRHTPLILVVFIQNHEYDESGMRRPAMLNLGGILFNPVRMNTPNRVTHHMLMRQTHCLYVQWDISI